MLKRETWGSRRTDGSWSRSAGRRVRGADCRDWDSEGTQRGLGGWWGKRRGRGMWGVQWGWGETESGVLEAKGTVFNNVQSDWLLVQTCLYDKSRPLPRGLA